MCGCNKSINGMKRKSRMNGLGDIGGILTEVVLPITGGILAGKVLSKQLTFLNANPNTGNLVLLGAGLFAASSMKGLVGKLGAGLAVAGAAGFIEPALKSAGIARLLPPGIPSAYIAGTPEAVLQTPTKVVVQ